MDRQAECSWDRGTRVGELSAGVSPVSAAQVLKDPKNLRDRCSGAPVRVHGFSVPRVQPTGLLDSLKPVKTVAKTPREVEPSACIILLDVLPDLLTAWETLRLE